MSISTANLNRGLIVFPQAAGQLYLGWRMLDSDPGDVSFKVFRKSETETEFKLLTTVSDSTNYIDRLIEPGTGYAYRIVTEGARRHRTSETVYSTAAGGKPYQSIPLAGDYSFSKIAIADLDGDGELEFLIKTTGEKDLQQVDPCLKAWHKSPGTYKLEAYKSDGTLMWRYEMGWSIELGVWYSPFIAYDLDGDGKAEVYLKGGEGDPRDQDGRVTSGPEYLIALDGESGREIRRIPWPARDDFQVSRSHFGYNFASRNFLAVAYLDGENPSLIVQRGNYTIIKTAAYDADLNLLWFFDTENGNEEFRGQGGHRLQVADIDDDGCDEIIIGTAAIDHDGRGMWSFGANSGEHRPDMDPEHSDYTSNPYIPSNYSHPDVVYVADFIPDRPGLEVFVTIEPARERNGFCLADARTGDIIWGCEENTKHVHTGFVGNIDPLYPGIECCAAERDGSRTWLYSSRGYTINPAPDSGILPLYWDDDEQKEIAVKAGDSQQAGFEIRKFRGLKYGEIEGQIIAVADCLGDWREELIVAVPGEIRIYSSLLPARNRRPCLLHNRQYRTGVCMQSMGYYSLPQLGSATIPG